MGVNIFCCQFLCSHRLLLVVSSRMTPNSPPDSISGHENFSKRCPKQGSKSVKNTYFSKNAKRVKIAVFALFLTFASFSKKKSKFQKRPKYQFLLIFDFFKIFKIFNFFRPFLGKRSRIFHFFKKYFFCTVFIQR